MSSRYFTGLKVKSVVESKCELLTLHPRDSDPLRSKWVNDTPHYAGRYGQRQLFSSVYPVGFPIQSNVTVHWSVLFVHIQLRWPREVRLGPLAFIGSHGTVGPTQDTCRHPLCSMLAQSRSNTGYVSPPSLLDARTESIKDRDHRSSPTHD